MRISILSIIVLFCVVQLLLMVLSFFEIISLETLFIELVSCMGVIVVGFNVHQLVFIIKLRQIPYKSRKHALCVRHLRIVCIVWSVAFFIKLLSAGLGKSLFQTDLENVDVY